MGTLWAALRGCRTVVELGCGFGVVLRQLTSRGLEAHGVEVFGPYLECIPTVAPDATSEQADALDWCRAQEDSTWDAMAMIDFIEHVPKSVGHEIIGHAQRIARRVVVLATPAGLLEQDAHEAFHIGTPGVPDILNPYQKHLCGWERAELEALGFHCTVRPKNKGSHSHDRIYAAWTR